MNRLATHDVQSVEITVPDASRARVSGILIVDDEAAIRKLLDCAFRREGYCVWLAADGAEGVSVYRSHQDQIDFVLLDVRMPALDGPQTLRALRELSPLVRCCFMSGQSGNYTDEDLLGLGVARVFRKPFRLGELLATVEQLVHSAVSQS